MTHGVVMVVYGDKAETAAHRATTALGEVCPEIPVHVHRERAVYPDDATESRWAKATLLDWTPFDHTAYMDADTQVYQDIGAGFQMLEDGYELVITPSQNQTVHDWLWHCGAEDKEFTRSALGFQALQLQAGVFFVRKTERTRRLWGTWKAEWMRHENQDQGAFLRALYQNPVKLWLLSREWNGGSVVGHHWGVIRR